MTVDHTAVLSFQEPVTVFSKVTGPLCIPTCNEWAGDTRDAGSITGSGSSPGGGHGNPLQCSCLENPMDRGAWQLQSTGSQRVGHEGCAKFSLEIGIVSFWILVVLRSTV